MSRVIQPVPESMSTAPDSGMRLSRNFMLRVGSGLVLAPLALVIMLVGDPLFSIGALIVGILAGLELVLMITHQRITAAVVIGVVLCAAVIIAYPRGWTALWLAPTLAGLVTALLGVLLLPSAERRSALRETALVLFGALLLGFVLAFAVALRAHPAGLLLWLLIVAGTWGTDTLAYAGGRAYGRHKLAPNLSPKKTIEGAVTGVVGGFVIALALLLGFELVLPVTLLLAAGVPFAATMGDLLESKVKRLCGVKDASIRGLSVIPGHGGMLDRIDSLLLVVLYVYAVMRLFAA